MTELTPGQEGSDEACQILLLLNRYPSGLSAASIAAKLSIDSAAVQRALIGLKTRHRVVSEGKGTTSVWTLMRYRLTSLV